MIILIGVLLGYYYKRLMDANCFILLLFLDKCLHLVDFPNMLGR